jgi:hypothetical protein
MAILYFCGHLVDFSRFDMLYQKNLATIVEFLSMVIKNVFCHTLCSLIRKRITSFILKCKKKNLGRGLTVIYRRLSRMILCLNSEHVTSRQKNLIKLLFWFHCETISSCRCWKERKCAFLMASSVLRIIWVKVVHGCKGVVLRVTRLGKFSPNG